MLDVPKSAEIPHADGKILHIDKMVKAADHGSDIAKKLAELKVSKKAE